MRLSLSVRDLLHAAWAVERESVARVLPPGVEPAEVDGRCLVSLFALRAHGSRFERLPVPRFSLLKVGTHVVFEGERAVFFFVGCVTPPGLPAALLGLPYRAARIEVRNGLVGAPGLGLSVRYEKEGATDPGELERAELGLMQLTYLRAFRLRRPSGGWTRARLAGPARADLLLALGFDVGDPASLLTMPSGVFEIELPARRARK